MPQLSARFGSAGLEVVGIVKELFDVAYSREHTDRRLMDVFLPTGEQANGAAFLFVHGGAWKAGDKAQWHGVARHFCGLGYVCASATYRLLPEWKFPAWVEDARLAMSFFRGKSGEYGFDPARVAAGGSSAGGYLVLMLGVLRPTDELGLTKELSEPDSSRRSVPQPDTRPQAVVAYCPAVAVPAEGVQRELPAEHVSGSGDVNDPTSVAGYVRGGEPPTLFLHGAADKLFPAAQSVELAERIKQAGGWAEAVILSGAEHGFGYGARTEHQKQAIAHVRRFLADHL